MKLALVIATGLVASLAGCATTPQAMPPVATTATVDDNIDYVRMNAINSLAKQRGVMVRWLQYPLKRASLTPATTGS